MYENEYGNISFHRKSKKGIVQDYVIRFNGVTANLQQIVDETTELVEELIDSFKSGRIVGRWIAKVNFEHFNFERNETSDRSYYFPSYHAEDIRNVKDFFQRHMMKIASRLEDFNENGSNLVVKNIEYIFIQLSVVK